MTRFVRKLAAAPIAAVAAAGMLVAGGGIALAASQGAVHVPFTGHDNRPADTPSATATDDPGVGETESPEPATEDSPSAEATASPSPSLEGLCVAFQAGAMDKAATNPAFTALQNAAGGVDNVDAYCVGLIGASTHPTHPAEPSHTPSLPAAASGHRGKPTSTPTPEIPEGPSRATTH